MGADGGDIRLGQSIGDRGALQPAQRGEDDGMVADDELGAQSLRRFHRIGRDVQHRQYPRHLPLRIAHQQPGVVPFLRGGERGFFVQKMVDIFHCHVDSSP